MQVARSCDDLAEARRGAHRFGGCWGSGSLLAMRLGRFLLKVLTRISFLYEAGFILLFLVSVYKVPFSYW